MQPVNLTYKSFPKGKSLCVVQNEYCILDDIGEKRYVGTFCADPCLMIFVRRPAQIYPQTKADIPARVVAVHLDATCDLDTLQHAITRCNSTEKLEISIVSGGHDQDNIDGVLELLEPVDCEIRFETGNGVDTAVLDIRTGEVIPCDIRDFDLYDNDISQRCSRVSTILLLHYDGTKPEYDIASATSELPIINVLDRPVATSQIKMVQRGLFVKSEQPVYTPFYKLKL